MARTTQTGHWMAADLKVFAFYFVILRNLHYTLLGGDADDADGAAAESLAYSGNIVEGVRVCVGWAVAGVGGLSLCVVVCGTPTDNDLPIDVSNAPKVAHSVGRVAKQAGIGTRIAVGSRATNAGGEWQKDGGWGAPKGE